MLPTGIIWNEVNDVLVILFISVTVYTYFLAFAVLVVTASLASYILKSTAILP